MARKKNNTAPRTKLWPFPLYSFFESVGRPQGNRRLNPKVFAICFQNWVNAYYEKKDKEVIAIDGKTLRRSFDRASEQSPVHLVSAYAHSQGIILGQLKTEDKSNEIKAIPKLLDLLDVKGRVVTTDAMGCQKEIANKVIEKKQTMHCASKKITPFCMKKWTYFLKMPSNLRITT